MTPQFTDGVTPITAAALNAMLQDIATALGGGQLPATLLDPGQTLGNKAATLFAPKVAAPTSAAAPGVFNRALSLYNYKPAQVRRLRAGLGRVKAQTGFCKLGFWGDSTVVGAYGGDTGKFSWPAQLKQFLAAAGYPSAGTGLVPCFNNYSAAEPRITLYSGEVSLGSFSNMVTNSTTLNGVQFDTTSTGETGTIMDVYYDDTSAPFDVNIDGGAKVRVTPGGTSAIKVYTVTGLTNATHQAIAWRVSGTMNILGFALRSNATYGVQTYNAGISGAKTDSLASATYRNVQQTMLKTSGWGADAVFIMCETNDAGQGTPVATFKANMQAAITAAVNAGSDVILVTGFPLNGTDLTPYTAALYDLADSNDLPLLDMQARWGTWAQANALGLYNDNAHPLAPGYADAGRALYKGLDL